MAADPECARSCAERRDRAARRRRIRPVRLLRIRHRDAALRRAREQRPPVRELPYDRALLTDACVPVDRTQPPHERHGPRRRARGRLPGLQRADPEGERLHLGDPRPQRLRDVRGRQVAPHTRRGDDDGEPPRSLAARSRVRALLRLHGRRDRPVPPGSHLRQPSRRPAAPAGGGLPPDRGSRRQGDPVPQGSPRHGAGQALLPVVHTRRVPRAAPSTRGVHRALPRSLRPGLGPLAGRRVRAPGRVRVAAARDRVLRATGMGARVGLVVGRPATARGPHDGGVRRVLDAHRRAGRRACSTSSTSSASSTTRSCSS